MLARTQRTSRRWSAATLVGTVVASAVLATAGSAQAATRFIDPGGSLGSCDSLSSPNGDYRLTMECAGNLVLSLQPENRRVWASGTSDPGSVLEMQEDGNVAVYGAGHVAHWATGTDGNPGSQLALQDDGNLVVVAPGNRAIWSTDTVGAGQFVETPRPGEARKTCAGSGAGGWRFSAEVSDNDGLVLGESSLNGRMFTTKASVPYLDGMFTTDGATKEARVELTPTPGLAHPGVVGSTLTDFQCSGTGDGDIFVSATYSVNDFIFGKAGPGGLSVMQEYLFRGPDDHRCEPSGKLSCARFWPTVSYRSTDPTACAGPSGSGPGGCTLFSGARTVQRLHLTPEGSTAGAIDAYRDLAALDGRTSLTAVATKGSDGSMRYEGVDQAIVNGERGDWDSIHQSPSTATSGPGVNPMHMWGVGFTPGCATCVHTHWAWDPIVNMVDFTDIGRSDFTDGKPQIRNGSTQSADFGMVRYGNEPDELDPVERGWRSLVDQEGSEASELRDHAPVVYWEMTGGPRGDASFPVLDDYTHGGNGAIFFGSAHQH